MPELAAKRDHQPARRASIRPERTRVLVYCGGVRTEPAYLEGIRGLIRDLPVAVEVRSRGVGPEQLIEHAVSFAARNPGFYDEIWCVIDVDEFDVESASQAAAAAGVRLAVSNPCFELWLLLHLADRRAFAENCDVIGRELRKHLPRYDKSRVRFGDFATGLPTAIERAKVLEPSGEDFKCNPSTGVWRLVERILQ